jgi:hypothetical protein|tara:strand:- start:197 stop:352 length:156 start_codon:yes stop_codon:yes gene_type:complete
MKLDKYYILANYEIGRELIIMNSAKLFSEISVILSVLALFILLGDRNLSYG